MFRAGIICNSIQRKKWRSRGYISIEREIFSRGSKKSKSKLSSTPSDRSKDRSRTRKGDSQRPEHQYHTHTHTHTRAQTNKQTHTLVDERVSSAFIPVSFRWMEGYAEQRTIPKYFSLCLFSISFSFDSLFLRVTSLFLLFVILVIVRFTLPTVYHPLLNG